MLPISPHVMDSKLASLCRTSSMVSLVILVGQNGPSISIDRKCHDGRQASGLADSETRGVFVGGSANAAFGRFLFLCLAIRIGLL